MLANYVVTTGQNFGNFRAHVDMRDEFEVGCRVASDDGRGRCDPDHFLGGGQSDDTGDGEGLDELEHSAVSTARVEFDLGAGNAPEAGRGGRHFGDGTHHGTDRHPIGFDDPASAF